MKTIKLGILLICSLIALGYIYQVSAREPIFQNMFTELNGIQSDLNAISSEISQLQRVIQNAHQQADSLKKENQELDEYIKQLEKSLDGK